MSVILPASKKMIIALRDHFLRRIGEKKNRRLSLSYGAPSIGLLFNRRNDASSQQHREIILKTFRFAISRKLCNDAILFFLCTLRVEQRVYITSIFFYRDRSLRVVDFRYFTIPIYRSILEYRSNKLYNFREYVYYACIRLQ